MDVTKKYAWTRIDKHGRMLVPAQLREELGLTPGTHLRLWVEDGSLRAMSLDEGVKRAQALAARYIKRKPGQSLVDEFIADRRRDSDN